jgi:catechol 2,3-dioxygenase-like lactoylglutathione lyase family enzyme
VTRAIGRRHHLVVDCREPRRLAEFWSAVLGEPVTYDDGDFVVVARNDHTSGLAFQRAADHRPPSWPDPVIPQQMHMDVMVDDVASAAARVLELGAGRLPGDNVFADPAGHPFCLVPRPGWAAPISDE